MVGRNGGSTVRRLGLVGVTLVVGTMMAACASVGRPAVLPADLSSSPSSNATATLPARVSPSPVRATAPDCRFATLRVSRAFWVSPQTQTDSDGVLIRNVANSRCELHAPVRAVVSDPGYPDLRTTSFVTAIGPGRKTVILAADATTELLIADSHGCARPPTHRYHHVTLILAEHAATVLLPDRSTSSDPNFKGRRLSLAVDEACRPMLSGLLPATVEPPEDVW